MTDRDRNRAGPDETYAQYVERLHADLAALKSEQARPITAENKVKKRKLIEGAIFDPPTLAVVGEAFDRAWSEISSYFSDDVGQIERARIRLAHSVLAVADEESRDPERLKRQALEIMALSYRERLRRRPTKTLTAGQQRAAESWGNPPPGRGYPRPPLRRTPRDLPKI